MTQSNQAPKPVVTLSPQDAAALDAIIESTPAHQDPPRTKNVQSWLNVLAAAPASEPSADLLNRTLSAVQAERMKFQPATSIENRKSKIENSSPRRWWSRHVADVAAMFIAAALLIAVIIPAVAHARYDYRRTLCAGNLSTIKTAFENYSSLYNHELPSQATPEDANWLHPLASDNGHTNTANLFPLVLATYITPNRLICPGRDLPPSTTITVSSTDIPDADYSYINLFGRYHPIWDGKASTIILADRNPLFCPTPTANPERNSRNHEGNGNYVLRADGQVTWETSPDIGPGKDNIWTINNGTQRLLTYTGTETPSTPTDIFLAP